MRAIFFNLLPVLLVFIFPPNGQADEFKRDIPNATWESIYFEPINQLAAKAGWKSLRVGPLPAGSLEIRIWIISMMPLRGYALRQDGSHWTGSYLADTVQHTNLVMASNLTPKSGWDKLWSRLVQLDLLTLPDSCTLQGEKGFFDGVSYVVEMNHDGGYRTYQYGNPEEQTWPEAKKIQSIVEALQVEFSKQ